MSRLEDLLERIVEQNEEIIEKLERIASAGEETKEELNWIGQHSTAKQIIEALESITSHLHAIEMNTGL